MATKRYRTPWKAWNFRMIDWAGLDGLDVFVDVFLDISRNINGSKVDLNLQGIVYLFA